MIRRTTTPFVSRCLAYRCAPRVYSLQRSFFQSSRLLASSSSRTTDRLREKVAEPIEEHPTAADPVKRQSSARPNMQNESESTKGPEMMQNREKPIEEKKLDPSTPVSGFSSDPADQDSLQDEPPFLGGGAATLKKDTPMTDRPYSSNQSTDTTSMMRDRERSTAMGANKDSSSEKNETSSYNKGFERDRNSNIGSDRSTSTMGSGNAGSYNSGFETSNKNETATYNKGFERDNTSNRSGTFGSGSEKSGMESSSGFGKDQSSSKGSSGFGSTNSLGKEKSSTMDSPTSGYQSSMGSSGSSSSFGKDQSSSKGSSGFGSSNKNETATYNKGFERDNTSNQGSGSTYNMGFEKNRTESSMGSSGREQSSASKGIGGTMEGAVSDPTMKNATDEAEKTRDDVNRRMNETGKKMKDEAKNRMDNLKDKTYEKKEQVKQGMADKVEKAADKVKRSAQSYKQESNPSETFTGKVGDTVSNVADKAKGMGEKVVEKAKDTWDKMKGSMTGK